MLCAAGEADAERTAGKEARYRGAKGSAHCMSHTFERERKKEQLGMDSTSEMKQAAYPGRSKKYCTVTTRRQVDLPPNHTMSGVNNEPPHNRVQLSNLWSLARACYMVLHGRCMMQMTCERCYTKEVLNRDQGLVIDLRDEPLAKNAYLES